MCHHRSRMVLELPERRQARVLPDRSAVARSGIQVRAALRTEAPAVVPAQRLHRYRQVELLTYEIVEIDLLVAVVAGLEIVPRHFGLELGRGLGLRQVPLIEGDVHRHLKWLEAAAARQLQLRLQRPLEAEPLLVLVDVEGELDRRYDPVRFTFRRHLRRIECALEMGLRLPDSSEIELGHKDANARLARYAVPQPAQIRVWSRITGNYS